MKEKDKPPITRFAIVNEMHKTIYVVTHYQRSIQNYWFEFLSDTPKNEKIPGAQKLTHGHNIIFPIDPCPKLSYNFEEKSEFAVGLMDVIIAKGNDAGHRAHLFILEQIVN